MNRRDLLKIGASVAAAPAAGIAQNHEHPVAGTAARPADSWKPELFDEHEAKTVLALVDLIIPATDTPGAKAALVDRHLDHILAAGDENQKTRFREGLWWIDGYALRKKGQPFAECAASDQTTILESLDAGTEAEIAPGHHFFGMLKSMTARIYYSTEMGFRELNKGGRVPPTFGCRHAEHS